MTSRGRTTAIVPCKNGARTIANTVHSLANQVLIDQVIVVDDGSTDETAFEANKSGARVIRLHHNLGKGAAMRAGIAAAETSDVFLFVDADTSITAGQVSKLAEAVERGETDLAIGTLPSAGGRGGFGIVLRVARWGIQRGCGFNAIAPLSGQRAATADLVKTLDIADGFAVEVAMTIDAVRAGARVLEIEVDMDHRHHGKNFRGFAHRGHQGIDVLRALWPRLVPKKARIACVSLLGISIALFLALTPGSTLAHAEPLPRANHVEVHLVPSWLWPEEPEKLPNAAAASVVTGDVTDVVNAVASGSRKSDAQPLPDVHVDVETSQSASQRDPSVAPPGTVAITAGVTTKDKQPALRPLVVAGANLNGSLVSPSTRTDGLVDLTDIAPTVLAIKGMPIPTSVEGSVLQMHPRESVDTVKLAKQSWSARFYAGMAPKVITAFVAAQTLLYLVAIALARSEQSLSGLAGWSLLVGWSLPVAAFPLATYLTYWVSGGAELSLVTWSALSALAMGIIVVMSLVGDSLHRSLIGLERILLLTILVFLADLITGSHLQRSGLFGSSPLLGTRYYGLGNPATTVLSLSTVLWSAIHIQRSPRRPNAVKRVVFVFGIVILAIGLPNLGADGGGLVAGVLTVAIALTLFAGKRISPRLLGSFGGAALAFFAIAAFVDHLRPASSQTHLGRMVNGGWSTFAETIGHRVDTNLFGYGFPWSLSVVVIAAVFAGGLIQGRWITTLPVGSPERAGAITAITAAFLIYLLNDSGIVVLALAAVFVGPYLMAEHNSATLLEGASK